MVHAGLAGIVRGRAGDDAVGLLPLLTPRSAPLLDSARAVVVEWLGEHCGAEVLRDERHSVVCARNGKEALAVLDRVDPCLMLLDIMMPVMDGYEMLRFLKDDDALKSIPVIAVTARAMKGDDEKCFEAGATDYIPKPIDMQNFISKMAKWL